MTGARRPLPWPRWFVSVAVVWLVVVWVAVVQYVTVPLPVLPYLASFAALSLALGWWSGRWPLAAVVAVVILLVAVLGTADVVPLWDHVPAPGDGTGGDPVARAAWTAVAAVYTLDALWALRLRRGTLGRRVTPERASATRAAGEREELVGALRQRTDAVHDLLARVE